MTEQTEDGQRAEPSISERLEHIEELQAELAEEIHELIEIETHAAHGQRKPKAKRYAFKVGRNRFEVTEAVLTGRSILEIAGLTPVEKYTLRQVAHGGVLTVIGLTDEVDLRAPGIERFRAMPRTAQDGCSP